MGILGIIVILSLALALSNNRKNINLRIVLLGLGLQILFALFILKTPIGKPLFGFFDKAISTLIGFSDAGGDFLFTSFVPEVGFHAALINFAFRALPTIIFLLGLSVIL